MIIIIAIETLIVIVIIRVIVIVVVLVVVVAVAAVIVGVVVAAAYSAQVFWDWLFRRRKIWKGFCSWGNQHRENDEGLVAAMEWVKKQEPRMETRSKSASSLQVRTLISRGGGKRGRGEGGGGGGGGRGG